jgi:hypothetical protein
LCLFLWNLFLWRIIQASMMMIANDHNSGIGQSCILTTCIKRVSV